MNLCGVVRVGIWLSGWALAWCLLFLGLSLTPVEHVPSFSTSLIAILILAPVCFGFDCADRKLCEVQEIDTE